MSKPGDMNWPKFEGAWSYAKQVSLEKEARRRERKRHEAELRASQQAEIDRLLSQGLNGQPVPKPTREALCRYRRPRGWV